MKRANVMASSVFTLPVDWDKLPAVTDDVYKILETLAKKHYPNNWRLGLNAMAFGYQVAHTLNEIKK